MSEFAFLNALAPESAPAEAKEAARARLRAAMAAERARARPSWRPRAVAAAAAGLVLIAVMSAWLLVRARPTAAAELERLAAAVEAIPAEEFPEGSLWYTRSEQRSLLLLSGASLPELGVGEFGVLLPTTREVWLAADGSLRLRTTTGDPVFFDEATAEAFLRSSLPATFGVGVTVAESFAPSEDRIDPADWPTDPGELEQAMRAEATRRGPQELPLPARLLGLAADLLRETGAQPELRAAVLHVLAGTDGLSVSPSAEPGVLQVAAAYEDEVGRWSRTIGVDAAGNLVTESETARDGIPAAAIPPGTEIFRARYQPTVVVPEAPG